jgi:hypothetical protein
MKLQLLAMVVFLLFPTTAAYCSRRHCRTLSVSTKKPASVAGFLFLMISKFRRAALVPSRSPSLLFPRSLKLIIQTPSSL